MTTPPGETALADEPGHLSRFVRRRPVGSLLVLVLACTAAWQATVYSGAWFGADDFVYQSRAVRDGLSWHYLGANYFGQFMPGGFFLAWAETRLSPLGWPIVVTVTVALHVLAGWTFWRLLRTVLRPTPLLVLPLTLYVVSPLTVPASNWWAASLNTLPLLVVLPLALTSHAHLLRTGRQRHALAFLGWYALGLLFFVKAALLLPLVLLLSRPLAHALGRQMSVREVLSAARLEVPLGALLLGVYAVVYLHAPQQESASGIQVPDNVPDLLSLYQNGIGHVLLPGLVGGPWHWIGTDAPTALSDVRYLPMLLSWLLVAAVVACAVVLRPSTTAAWVAALLWAGADLTFVAVGRLNQLNGSLALESHYVADSVPLVWLAVALSFCERRGQGGVPDWSRLPMSAALRVPGRQLAVGLTTALTVSALVSVHAFTTERQPRQAARTFVETAARSIRGAGDHVQVLDRPVPGFLLNGLFLDEARASHVLLPVTPAARRDDLYAVAAEKPKAFDDAGHLRSTSVSGVALQSAPTPGCGWLVQGQSLDLPWTSTVFELDWYVRVGYLSTQDGPVEFRFGGTTVATRVHPGLGELTFPVKGGGTALTVEVPTGMSVCIGDAQIGTLELTS